MMMIMAVIALLVIAVWMVLAGVVRGALHRRYGSGPPVRFADRRGSAQWWARAIGTLGFVLLVLAPIAELAGLPPFDPLDRLWIRLLGLVLALAGIIGIVIAQAAMGASWRGDVDPEAHAELVTTGPFRWVRNPIFTASAVASLGVALMVPNAIALAMLVAILATYQIQVRLVEEPYLERVHGERFRAYAERTGRFLPRIGRSGAERSREVLGLDLPVVPSPHDAPSADKEQARLAQGTAAQLLYVDLSTERPSSCAWAGRRATSVSPAGWASRRDPATARPGRADCGARPRRSGLVPGRRRSRASVDRCPQRDPDGGSAQCD
jgi:protein-S-isoprenylcysteine O-methyltransferase Ste14